MLSATFQSCIRMFDTRIQFGEKHHIPHNKDVECHERQTGCLNSLFFSDTKPSVKLTGPDLLITSTRVCMKNGVGTLDLSCEGMVEGGFANRAHLTQSS